MTGTDGLVVSGGGQTAVATDELFAVAGQLERMSADADEARARLTALTVVTDGRVSARVPSARQEALTAANDLGRAAASAARLSVALRLSAEAYGAVERGVMHAASLGSGLLCSVLGRLAPFILVAAAPWTVGAGASVLTGLALAPGGPRSPAEIAEWISAHPRLVNNPVVTAAVRLLVSSADDALAGFLGVPPGAIAALGDDGARLFGIREATGVLLIAAGGIRALTGGAFVETPVAVAPVSRARVAVPRSVAQLADRVPASADGRPQIRIEEYRAESGGSSWILYLGGTVDLSVHPGAEPFDMTSNLESMGGGSGASYRAALDAMRQAGIGPDDPVFEVGYSQGGLVAVQLEQSGLYDVRGLLTLGAPVGQLETAAPTLTVAHTEDLVPALGGLETAESENRVAVRRSLYDDAPAPTGTALPAHLLTGYRETAALLDQSTEPRVLRFRGQLAGFVADAAQSGTAIEYRADRVSASGPGPG